MWSCSAVPPKLKVPIPVMRSLSDPSRPQYDVATAVELGDLDRFGTTGVTDSFLTRLQWIF